MDREKSHAAKIIVVPLPADIYASPSANDFAILENRLFMNASYEFGGRCENLSIQSLRADRSIER